MKHSVEVDQLADRNAIRVAITFQDLLSTDTFGKAMLDTVVEEVSKKLSEALLPDCQEALGTHSDLQERVINGLANRLVQEYFPRVVQRFPPELIANLVAARSAGLFIKKVTEEE